MPTVGIESAFALIIVAAVMLGFFYVLNRYKNKYLYRSSESMSIESQITVGYRQRLILVKVRNKTILLTSSHDAVTVIETWHD